MCNLKNRGVQVNLLQNSNRVTDIENKLMVTKRGRGELEGVYWEIGIDMYTTVYKIDT